MINRLVRAVLVGLILIIMLTSVTSSATPIDFGQTLSGSIDAAAEMDSYTFSANANDNIVIRVSRTSGDM